MIAGDRRYLLPSLSQVSSGLAGLSSTWVSLPHVKLWNFASDAASGLRIHASMALIELLLVGTGAADGCGAWLAGGWAEGWADGLAVGFGVALSASAGSARAAARPAGLAG